jgi:hypothetical protein
MRAATASAFLLLACIGWVLGSVEMATALPLTGDQEHRLVSCEIILVDALPSGASESAGGGTAIALVRAPVEKVWSILIDYRNHPRYYPRVTSVEVVSGSERHALVRYVAAIGLLSFSFHMDKYPDAARRRIEWQLAKGHSNSLFLENSGYWQVDPREEASVVTYALAVRTVVPAFLTRVAERDSLVDTINGLRKLAEADEAGGKACRKS